MDSGTEESSDEFYESDDLEDIHAAIVNDDVDQLQEICSQGVDVNEKFKDEMNPQHYDMTPLGLAAALNRLDHVKVLLHHGADSNASFANLKTTALMTASFHGNVDVVKLLLESGANPQAVDMQGSTALGYCFGGSRSIDVISMLLKAGVDVNQKNMLGMNALLLVAGYGNDLLVRMVIESGADPNSVNDFGHTPLHLAVVGKRSLIGAVTSGRGMTSLYGLNRRNLDRELTDWAHGHLEFLSKSRINESELEKAGKFMMAIGNKLNTEPENVLCNDDQEAMMKRLDAVIKYRQEKLHTAKDIKKPGVMDALLSCGGRRAKQVKSANSSSAPQDRPQDSRLQTSSEVDRDVTALSNRCARILKFILDAGCDSHQTEYTYGMTALDMALVMGDVESTVILLAAGCDPDHLLKLFAMTDLFEAISRRDKKLLRSIIDNDHYVDINGSFELCNVDSRSTDDGNKGDAGLTPLAVAAKAPDSSTVDIIKMLIKKGADINKIGSAGRSPLGESCRWGNKKMVEFLLNQGADIEAPNPAYNNATAVAVAVISKQTEIVEYLISKGAKIDRPMSDGRTTLIKALDADDMPMIDTLLENSDLELNFCDRNGFLFRMAEKYKQPNRDIEWILGEIREHSQQLEAQGKKLTTAQTELNPFSKYNKTNLKQTTSLAVSGFNDKDDTECSSQESPPPPRHRPPPVSNAKTKKPNSKPQRSPSRESSDANTTYVEKSKEQTALANKSKEKNIDKVAAKSGTKEANSKKGNKILINLPPPPSVQKDETEEDETEEDETESDDDDDSNKEPKLQFATNAPLSGVLRKTTLPGSGVHSLLPQKPDQQTVKMAKATKSVSDNRTTVVTKAPTAKEIHTGNFSKMERAKPGQNREPEDDEEESEEEESEDEDDEDEEEDDEEEDDEEEDDEEEEDEEEDEEEEDDDDELNSHTKASSQKVALKLKQNPNETDI